MPYDFKEWKAAVEKILAEMEAKAKEPQPQYEKLEVKAGNGYVYVDIPQGVGRRFIHELPSLANFVRFETDGTADNEVVVVEQIAGFIRSGRKVWAVMEVQK